MEGTTTSNNLENQGCLWGDNTSIFPMLMIIMYDFYSQKKQALENIHDILVYKIKILLLIIEYRTSQRHFEHWCLIKIQNGFLKIQFECNFRDFIDKQKNYGLMQ